MSFSPVNYPPWVVFAGPLPLPAPFERYTISQTEYENASRLIPQLSPPPSLYIFILESKALRQNISASEIKNFPLEPLLEP